MQAAEPEAAAHLRCVRLFVWLAVILAGSSALVLPVAGQTLAHKGWAGSGMVIEPWWQQAVFYQIDPISFQDANGDGFGDLRGIVQRLDYLRSLHVDAIVLSPFSLEPKFAAGQGGPAFDPAYGTVDDFDQLVSEVSRRHMRLLVDLPINQAHSAEEAGSTTRYWFTHGVAGVRVTLAASAGQAAQDGSEIELRLAAVRSVVAGSPGQRVLMLDLPSGAGVRTAKPSTGHGRTPHHGTSRGRAVSSAGFPSPALTASTSTLRVERQVAMPSMLSAEVLSAALEAVNRTSASSAQPAGTKTAAAFPVFASDSAERRRSYSRYDDSEHAPAIAKALATLLFTTRADPMLFFGQEIGMESAASGTGAAVGSSVAVAAAAHPGVDGSVPAEPSPMQWGPDGSGSEGFSTFEPWIALGPNAGTQNVAAEEQDSDSLLNWYRKLSLLRHEQASLREGSFQALDLHTPGVLAWLRLGAKVGGLPARPVLVVLNLSPRASVIPLKQSLAPYGVTTDAAGLRVLAFESGADPADAALSGGALTLDAYGVYVGEFTTQRGLQSVATPVRRSARRGR